MIDIFQPFLRKFIIVFFDDILAYSKSIVEHLPHLRQVFTALRSHQLFSKYQKCILCQPQIEYLGHIIDAMGVSTDPAKIQAIVYCPPSTSLKVMRILGSHRIL